MTATASEMKRPALWTAGDWNAFFGFGTNILVNMLVLTGLLRFVLKMPDSIVFGRILPALGLMMCLSTFYYAWLAYKLAQKTGRSDVCALPSGVSDTSFLSPPSSPERISSGGDVRDSVSASSASEVSVT